MPGPRRDECDPSCGGAVGGSIPWGGDGCAREDRFFRRWHRGGPADVAHRPTPSPPLFGCSGVRAADVRAASAVNRPHTGGGRRHRGDGAGHDHRCSDQLPGRAGVGACALLHEGGTDGRDWLRRLVYAPSQDGYTVDEVRRCVCGAPSRVLVPAVPPSMCVARYARCSPPGRPTSSPNAAPPGSACRPPRRSGDEPTERKSRPSRTGVSLRRRW